MGRQSLSVSTCCEQALLVLRSILVSMQVSLPVGYGEQAVAGSGQLQLCFEAGAGASHSLFTSKSLLDAAKPLPGISLLVHCHWQHYAGRAPLAGCRAAVVQSATVLVSNQTQRSGMLCEEHGTIVSCTNSCLLA